MNEFISDIIFFVQSKTVFELFLIFWFYIVFDFTRYVLFDSVVIFIYLIKRQKVSKENKFFKKELFTKKPLLTVMAPGKNEGKNIPGLVESLKKQTYKNFEVIIVDDGSDDNTPDICRNLQKNKEIDLYLRNNIRGGKASAANLGLRYAKGKYIIHLDADTELKNDALEKIILPFLKSENTAAVSGDLRVLNVNNSLTSSLQALEYMKTITTGRTVNSTLGILRIVSGAYGAFRTDVLKRLGGWDVGPGLDGDITIKIRKLGYDVLHDPESVAYTNVPTKITKLAKQRYRWDKSLVRFRLRRHKDLLFLKNNKVSIKNFWSIFDNIFYNLVLNIKWWIYFIQIAFFMTGMLKYIITINFFLYFFSNILEYIFGLILMGKSLRKKDIFLFTKIPLMPFYSSFFLRIVRSYAYIMEFLFKQSYKDPWNPWKVSQQTFGLEEKINKSFTKKNNNS